MKTIKKDWLDDLDVESLVRTSSSDQIHVWIPPKKGEGKVNSVDMDPDDALKHYKKGASLYFGSTVEFRELYVRRLAC